MQIQFKENKNGPKLGYTNANIIEKDGLYFKNFAKDGILKPYEDWRLDATTRAKDLASRMSIEEIAGLMLYSPHQSLPAVPFMPAHYKGKTFENGEANAWDLTDEQLEFLTKDNIRHILLMIVESAETAARWNNNVQELCEKTGLGIPVNSSSDPRHGADATAEFNMGAAAIKRVSKWPESLGFAATFSPEIVREFGKIAAKEYRAMGIATALSPQVDIATDPRWFRFSGTFGEDSQLSTDMAEAYIDGFQTSENGGWGNSSVNTMVKHWPGGGSGEAGRDAHFGCGKFAVYPNKNYDEHMKPFLDGAFKLKGNTQKAAAVMPYYTISFDLDNDENVGNSFNKHIITDLLRGKYGYDGVVCTDWGITADEIPVKDLFFSGKCWGAENLTVSERHYKALKAGVDQFGGNSDKDPVIDAYNMGVAEFGEEKMRARFERSAVRLLTNIFRVGLFENPYLNEIESAKIVNNDNFAKTAFEAQEKSIVLLKNKNNVLPIKGKKSVYIPKRHRPAGKNWFGFPTPEVNEYPVDLRIVGEYFDVVNTPEEADFGLVFVQNPKSGIGYDGTDLEKGGNGYVPISLQYRPYTADGAREKSIAGDKRADDVLNRSYNGKSTMTTNECDLDAILDAQKAMNGKPVIVSLQLQNPCILSEFEKVCDAIIVDFGVQTEVILNIITGIAEPSGLLPMQMPADMKTVETQFEDTAHDMKCHKDSENNVYDFGYGMNWSGVISDARTKKYCKKSSHHIRKRISQ